MSLEVAMLDQVIYGLLIDGDEQLDVDNLRSLYDDIIDEGDMRFDVVARFNDQRWGSHIGNFVIDEIVSDEGKAIIVLCAGLEELNEFLLICERVLPACSSWRELFEQAATALTALE
jgi:hypothetical protein